MICFCKFRHIIDCFLSSSTILSRHKKNWDFTHDKNPKVNVLSNGFCSWWGRTILLLFNQNMKFLGTLTDNLCKAHICPSLPIIYYVTRWQQNLPHPWVECKVPHKFCYYWSSIWASLITGNVTVSWVFHFNHYWHLLEFEELELEKDDVTFMEMLGRHVRYTVLLILFQIS